MDIWLWTTTNKTLNQDQLLWLQNEANKYGWISSSNFQNYVNTNYWQGAYDVLKQWVTNTWLQSQNQNNVNIAQKLTTPTPTPPSPTPTGSTPWAINPPKQEYTGNLGYTSDQVGIQWVNVSPITQPVQTTQAGQVETKPPMGTGVQTTPTQPTQTTNIQPVNANIDSIVDSALPKWTYTDDERNALKQALQGKNPEEITSIMAEQAKGNFEQSKQLLSAYRTTRDFALNSQREQTLNDRRVQDLTQQYDNAIQQQKQRIDADANNMWVVLWTAWRLQSRNMVNAVNQVLDNNKNIYNQLISNKDRDIQRLGEDLAYAQKVASNEYNDMVSQEMQDMLKNVQALDSSGSLNTAQGLLQARDFLDKTISNNMQHQADYYNKLSYISQRFDAYHKEALELWKVDDSVTKTMNDWYLYNSQWTRIKGENGQPIKVEGSTSWTLLTKEPITLNDWSKGFVYQNQDWTMRVEKITWTQPSQIDQTTISKYAQALSTWLLDIADLQKMWVSNESINQIVAQTNGKVETMSPYQTAQIELEKQKQALEQQKFDALNGVITTGTASGQVPPLSVVASFAEDRVWSKNIQCGQLVNDAIATYAPNIKWDMGNDYASKLKVVQEIWLSNIPQPWSVFVSNPKNNEFWHTWIVQSVNPDWSFVVMEANKDWSEKWWPTVSSTYKSTAWMTFSKPVVLEKSSKADIIPTILWSGKFTKDQKNDLIKSINSWEDPLTVIKNQAKNILWQTEATKLTNYEVARDTLSDLWLQLQEFYKMWGDTWLLDWTLSEIANKFWKVTDPNLSELAVQIEWNIQVYRNAISGTAFSNQEKQSIDSIFPWIKKSKDLNNIIIKWRDKLFNATIDSMYGTAIWKDTYKKLKEQYWEQGKTIESQSTPTQTSLSTWWRVKKQWRIK